MPSTTTPTSDDGLLARLNALRTSSVTLSETKSPLPTLKKLETPETALSDRLKALRTASESSHTSLSSPSSPPSTSAPISPPGKGAPHGPEEGPNLDEMGRPRWPPNESLEHGSRRPDLPATRLSANAIFREGRRQAEALEESIKSATSKFESEGDVGKLKMDAAKANADALTAAAKEEEEERKHERRVEVWKEEDRVKGEKREKRLRDDAVKAIEKAEKTLAAKEAGAPTSDDDDDDDEGDEDTDESDAVRQRRRRLAELESDDNYEHRDEDAEADAILAEMMDDVGLDFEEDARKGLFQQHSPPKLSPPPALINRITSREKKADPGVEAHQGEEEEDEFQMAMKARMTALRSPSPQLPSSLELLGPLTTEPVDSLGLPSVPTSDVNFKGTGAQAPKEDYICKVCYAPATVFCEGCEEDFEGWDTKEDAMFCARCWKEVHLGEDAGDERKHEWAPVRRGN